MGIGMDPRLDLLSGEDAMPYYSYPFEVMPLPYPVDALEPYIDAKTMQVHHDRLARAYVERLNAALAGYPQAQKLSLEQMLENPSLVPEDIRLQVLRMGGGVYNHNFFFRALRPGYTKNSPIGSLRVEIDRAFGSYEAFKKEFSEEAAAVFGSGWMWLVKDGGGKLTLLETENQECPLTFGYSPVTVIDVWEHAYFLQYLNLRTDYIDNWYCIVNWLRADGLFGGYSTAALF